jgi:hypothetical protein
MAHQTYTKCRFVSTTGDECNEWFAADGIFLCPKYHRNIPSASNNHSEEQKDSFIALCNDERTICASLSIQELQQHISDIKAEIEQFIAQKKTRHQTARAVLGERMEQLTEEQRAELRKATASYKFEAPKQKKNTQFKPKSLEGKLSTTLKTSESVAKDFMTMDIDALMAKYKKAKEE